MKKLAMAFLFIPTIVFAKTCEVPKERIKFADVYLNGSVLLLSKKHNEIEVDNPIINEKNAKVGKVFISPKNETGWLYGTPISSFNYISYLKPSYKINSFGLNLDLGSYDLVKVKTTLVTLFDLPKKEWIKKNSTDSKYGTVEEFIYKCSQYSITISQSSFGTSLIMSN